MKQLLYFVIVLFTITSFASNPPDGEINGILTGTVIDKKLKQPIPYVTVVIKTLSGEVVTGGITTDDGKFSIAKIPAGKYEVSIQFIGYKTYSSTIEISKKNKKVNLGEIFLEEDAEVLDEVVVVADVSTIQQKIDRKVITVGKDLTTSGPTASDIMNNLPSVSIDQQTGELSLRGNQNVRVMVDGKLTNVPIAQLLKQIPSTSIKQIELITNPSAKYNPEGMSGIINIILHKNVKLGFNGNINIGLTYQRQAKFNSNIDLNYRAGKINIYGNWGNNVSANENFGRTIRLDDELNQDFNFLSKRKSNLFKVGIDYYPNSKNTLSFFTNQNIFDGNTTGITTLTAPNPVFDITQKFIQLRDNNSSQYNFNYKLDFNDKGHNIELETDLNTLTENQQGIFLFTGNNPVPDYDDFIDTTRERITVNLDYVNPISETTKLEAGAEARLFNTKLNYRSNGLSFNADGELIPTPETKFTYNRDIYSVYATFGKKLNKWNYQLGVRAETVTVKADTSNVRSFENDYIQIYPSAFITYQQSEKNQYQISYSRRVDRPGVSQVNPVRDWSTPLITFYGNSNLRPQFTNSFEFNYTRKIKGGNFTAGMFYRIIQDEINRAIFIDRTDINRVILTFDNFDNTTAYGIEFSSNYRPTKWWMINGSFDLYSQTQKGITEKIDTINQDPDFSDIYTEIITVNNILWSARIFNNFKINKNFSLSAFGMYRGKNKRIQSDINPMYLVNIGARYNLWKGNGTVSLNYNDIFNTMRFGFNRYNPFPSTGEFNWESNTVNVSLSYRFGGSNYKAKERKKRDKDEKTDRGGMF